jgi:hypothetical protein
MQDVLETRTECSHVICLELMFAKCRAHASKLTISCFEAFCQLSCLTVCRQTSARPIALEKPQLPAPSVTAIFSFERAQKVVLYCI